MADREQIIKLLDDYYLEESSKMESEKLADYLLENGVIVLPCKVGDTVYKLVDNHCCTCSELDYCSIYERSFCLDMLNDIGKTVFLTKEEAERALKDGE